MRKRFSLKTKDVIATTTTKLADKIEQKNVYIYEQNAHKHGEFWLGICIGAITGILIDQIILWII